MEEKKLENELNNEQHNLNVDELNRKRLDHLDVEEAIKLDRESHRQSLAQRLVKSKLDREMDLMLHQENLNKLHEEFELKRLGHKDVQEYQRKEKESRRKSLEMRLQSHKNYKMEQLKLKQEAEIRKGEGKKNYYFIIFYIFLI